MSSQGDDRPPDRPEEPERPEGGGEPEDPDRQEEPPKPDEGEKPERPERPEYTVYGGRRGESGGRRMEPPRPKRRPDSGERPPYRVYRSRPSLRDRFRKPDLSGIKGERPGGGWRERLRGFGGQRPWLRWILIGAAAWLVLSFVTFAISAQTQKSKLPDEARQALEGGPDVLVGQNILILGGDRRGETQKNATGTEAQGPPRADTIMVLHAALTSFRKLSIPRDAYAAIPNCGEQKINASLACNTNSPDGNIASTINTVKDFLGIDLHHIVIIDFDGFADLIDTLGGVEVKVKSKTCGDVDGGKKQGGVSIQLKAGEHTLEGQKALAYARLRQNTCQPGEDDTDRAARQQAILNGIKGRLTSPLRFPYNFIKGPWIGWNAPKAFISDMGAFTLPQVAIAAILGGSGNTNVLGRDNVSPGPDNSLFIPQGECRRAVEDLTGGEPDRDPACSPG
jgi:LCP family protein required for cell wall assembly